MLIADTIGRRGESRMKDNNIRKTAMTNVPIAAMTWLMGRPEMNTPMEIIAAPYSSVPM